MRDLIGSHTALELTTNADFGRSITINAALSVVGGVDLVVTDANLTFGDPLTTLTGGAVIDMLGDGADFHTATWDANFSVVPAGADKLHGGYLELAITPNKAPPITVEGALEVVCVYVKLSWCGLVAAPAPVTVIQQTVALPIGAAAV